MNIFLNKEITSASINGIIIADQTKKRPLSFMGIFGTVYKTKNGTTVPISEPMNLLYVCRGLLQNIR